MWFLVTYPCSLVQFVFEEYALGMSFESQISRISKFASDRDWEQFHSVRNLTLALVGEVGELVEIIQWVSDESIDEFLDDPRNQSRFEEELADVLIYLLRLASIRHIDIERALTRKLENNEKKYPVTKSKGSSKKYTEI